jgi:hypothetical protein
LAYPEASFGEHALEIADGSPRMKGVVAVAFASGFLVVAVARYPTGRNLASTLQALGIGCFAIMAATHIFEVWSTD